MIEKNHMKRVIILAFSMLLSSAILWGQQTIYVIDNVTVDNFDGSQLKGKNIKDYQITTTGKGAKAITVHAITTAPSINAIFGEASAISSKPSHDWTWHRDGAQLYLSGVPEGTTVRLYDLRGMMIRSVVSDGSEIVLPLGSSQFHILKVGEITVKF